MSFETAGLILLGFGVLLLVADAFLGLGIVTDVAAPVVMAIGAILLVHDHSYDPPAWVVVVIVAAIAAFLVSTVFAFRRARGAAFGGDAATMVGRSGIARTGLTPDGLVAIKGEQWPARSARGIVRSGERVIVTGTIGNRLLVDSEEGAKPGASLPRRL